MPVDWNTEVVDQVESHWRLQLRPRLNGLTDDEYFWQPVPGCWTVSPRGRSEAPMSLGRGDFTWDYGEPGPDEPMTTIAWRLAHVTVGLAETNGARFGGPPADPADFAYAGTAEQALTQLDRALAHWLAGVKGLGEEGLAAPQGAIAPADFADAPVVRSILYTSVEIIHHGAEVCLMRDLYARSDRARASDLAPGGAFHE